MLQGYTLVVDIQENKVMEFTTIGLFSCTDLHGLPEAQGPSLWQNSL